MSAAPLSAEGFARLADVSHETLAPLALHLDLVRRWQQRMNLVGPRSLDDPWRRHVLDSAQIARFVPARATRIVDIGSGAGFPGLVLALLGGDAGPRVDLIESDRRKAAFLETAIRETGARARAVCARAESRPVAPAPAVTARACAPLAKLLAWARPLLADGGVAILHKGRRVDAELTAARRFWKMDAARHPSLSDPDGTVLTVGAFEPVGGRRSGC